jgi:ppGpp synthetase/RelA/SpoT-type nucleotidyltranferase
MTTAAAAAFVAFACQASPAFSFGNVASTSSKTRGTSSVYFTVDDYHASHSITAEHIFNSGPFLFRSQQYIHQLERDTTATANDIMETPTLDDAYLDVHDFDMGEPRKALPAWLREDKGHLVQENMDKLRSAMLSSSSFFTESEAMKLTYAIREAGQNDPHKMAGAAEFCLIMVETMEMGLNALVAAAFHFCECIDARERAVRTFENTEDVDSLSHWEFRLPPLEIHSFGDHAAKIERDAARLKRLEIVASMVVHNSNTNEGDVAKKAADNLRNLYTTEAKDWRALAIRGAACLYRLRGILKDQELQEQPILTKEANRVCREAFRIYAPLASRMGMHRLKNELEHAAFQILYRRQHRTYESLLRQTRSSENIRSAARKGAERSETSEEPNIGENMEEILAHVKETMTEFLENDPVFMASVTNFSVTARVKESYSTWRKMLRNGFDHITQVPDALALRIVLDAKKEHSDESDAVTRARERALCYYAQQLCKTVWRPYEGDPRFKDYIATPKENGYQSLHYTAGTKWNNEDWRMEIQIRTGEMHKVAEFGVASHWNYKAIAKPSFRERHHENSNDISQESLLTVETFMVDQEEQRDDPFGKVTIANNDRSSDAYLRSLQEWHWETQHGSSPIRQIPLVLWDNEAESRERAERIRARTQRLAPYLEALANEQDDLQRKNVFVFLAPQKQSSEVEDDETNNGYPLPTEGTVVALPAGASILDAIRKCDLPMTPGNANTNFVIRNGTPASLDSQLQNGDVLSIPTVTACLTPL